MLLTGEQIYPVGIIPIEAGRKVKRRRRSPKSATAAFSLPSVLRPRVSDRLPLEIGDRIWSATGERYDVDFPVAGTGAVRLTGQGTRVLSLKLARYRMRSMFVRRSEARHVQSGKSDPIRDFATPTSELNPPVELGDTRRPWAVELRLSAGHLLD
jgi:hypothetical protein